MAPSGTQLDEYVADQVKKYGQSLVPVKTPWMVRLLVKSMPVSKLHPNPEDEFCDPNIGPNYGIISKYEKEFRQIGTKRMREQGDPIIIEKVRPDGFMILNGHHRWAAAMRCGIKSLPVQIANLTMETDIRKMLKASQHDKRVSLDLDEVVFCDGTDRPAEKPLPFIYKKIFTERIRKGLPALMHYLSMAGYDIWVYTTKYYSYDYIHAYFKRYSVKVDGVITGTARKRKGREFRKRTQQLFEAKYKETITIDNDMVLRTFSNTGKYEEHTLKHHSSGWANEVTQIIKGMVKDEEQ